MVIPSLWWQRSVYTWFPSLWWQNSVYTCFPSLQHFGNLDLDRASVLPRVSSRLRGPHLSPPCTATSPPDFAVTGYSTEGVLLISARLSAGITPISLTLYPLSQHIDLLELLLSVSRCTPYLSTSICWNHSISLTLYSLSQQVYLLKSLLSISRYTPYLSTSICWNHSVSLTLYILSQQVYLQKSL